MTNAARARARESVLNVLDTVKIPRTTGDVLLQVVARGHATEVVVSALHGMLDQGELDFGPDMHLTRRTAVA